jgi:hypothetical protein
VAEPEEIHEGPFIALPDVIARTLSGKLKDSASR